MALSDVMDSIQKTADSKAAKDLTEQDFIDNMDGLRNLIAFFRWYPDLFIDYIKKPDNPFNFYFNQRIILRAMMRYQKSFMTFPRAFSKSFLAMMCHMIRATLYPNSQLFLTTGGKEQAARITMQKIIEICNLLPELAEEIDFSRGETQKGRDNVTFKWKNGSSIDILAATDSSRGQRRNCGIIEEARDCLNISFPIYQWGYTLKVC